MALLNIEKADQGKSLIVLISKVPSQIYPVNRIILNLEGCPSKNSTLTECLTSFSRVSRLKVFDKAEEFSSPSNTK